MSIRVAHWGTGQTGRMALQGIIGHSDLQLVGLYVEREGNVGRDAGELCDRPPTGVKAVRSVAELLALKPDCVSYFGSGAGTQVRLGVDNIVSLLEAGCDVVTTSLMPLIHPMPAHEQYIARIQAACRVGNSRFFATGIEPGFASDVLPTALLGIVDELEKLHIREIADYSRYGVEPVMRDYFGFGKPADYAVPVLARGQLAAEWGGVVKHLARMARIEVDDLAEVTEVALTAHPLDTAFGIVDSGTIAGVRFEVQGRIRGKPVIIIEHVNILADDVAPHWERARTGKDCVYRIDIQGRPTMRCELAFDCIAGEEHGLIATAMRAINAIPVIRSAAPGVLLASDVPVRASGHLSAKLRNDELTSS